MTRPGGRKIRRIRTHQLAEIVAEAIWENRERWTRAEMRDFIYAALRRATGARQHGQSMPPLIEGLDFSEIGTPGVCRSPEGRARP